MTRYGSFDLELELLRRGAFGSHPGREFAAGLRRQADDGRQLVRMVLAQRSLQWRTAFGCGLEQQAEFGFLLHGTVPSVHAVDGFDVHTGSQALLDHGTRQSISIGARADAGEDQKNIGQIGFQRPSIKR